MSDIKTVLDETPFQTAGPFLHIGCLPNAINIEGVFDNDLGVKPFSNKHPEMTDKVCALVEFEKTEFAHNAVKDLSHEGEEGMKVKKNTNYQTQTSMISQVILKV